MGPIPDFGGDPLGCQGKIDFLFIVANGGDAVYAQTQLQELFPHFIDTIKSEFADFDYHIMVTGTSPAYLKWCDACYMCDDCVKPGCADFGGPEDYPCDVVEVDCDVKMGAGVTFIGNFGGSNKRCELAGGNRFITSEEGDNLNNAFECISTLGAGMNWSYAELALVQAFTPEMLASCNAGFIRPDALLALIVVSPWAETMPDYQPWYWYKQMKNAKKGNGDAIVTLVISNDRDVPRGACQPSGGDTNFLRLLAEEEADHGVFGSYCAPSYVPFFDEAAGMILEQCSLLIPQ
ncbi:hypothetical protein OV203_46685 [Nannocystis sp. ILAH1]|uniref:hypothetical protein n=1 Tax=Nannocystis sp. ILAH1 TaxID=2996789 RepID=UPI0022718059|nr:hypothetical protein [Nannocystis sp. ILAH1]MCY0994702.1 hypothetical protein [Nannocystis sp. ILAH1]